MATLCRLAYYPYRFVMRGTDGHVPYRLYHFRSPKTHRWYIARVEEHPYHFYGIKFHLKSDAHNPNKYNRLTGLSEVRPLIKTCIAILLEIAQHEPESSFGFIGANLIGESNCETKRFRVYRRVLTSYFSEDVFLHYQIVQQSAYAMVRKSALLHTPDLIDKLNAYFSDNYTNFD